MKYKIILLVFLLGIFFSGKSDLGTNKTSQFNRQLFFEGNSLLNLGVCTTTPNGSNYDGKYIPTSIYNTLKSTHTLSMFSYAIESRTGTQILADTLAIPRIKRGDILVYWEGTNDLYVHTTMTGAQAFANFTSYLTYALAKGGKVIACTITARDYSLDAADLMTRIGDYNTLMRNNTSLGYTLCDLGAGTEFDQRADCSVSPPYSPDKIHFIQQGQDTIAARIYRSINSIY